MFCVAHPYDNVNVNECRFVNKVSHLEVQTLIGQSRKAEMTGYIFTVC